jgi:hypothetical protein
MLMNRHVIISAPSFKAIKFLFIALLTSHSITAGEVNFSASAPASVAVGEQFRLTYTINRQAGNLRLPDLGDFRLISGPATSSSSSLQYINGQRTQSHSSTFTYTLQATQAGSFTLGPATLISGPDHYTSNTVTIEVVTDSEGRTSVPDRPGTGTGRNPGNIAGEDIFVRIILDKNEVFQGEGIMAVIKIYSKLDLTGIENVRFPAFSGFYQQDIETPPLRSLNREVINGEIYGTGILKQVILFPQRSGELNIGSFEMDATVRQQTGRRGSVFDDFWGGYETRRIPVKSPPITLRVKPLPGGSPSDFSGGVGSFRINADIESGIAKTNEALSMRITISGHGNLRLLGWPVIDFPEGFEVYDPNIRENITNGARGQEGSITYEYLIIPRSTGDFRIPPVQFSFFDPLQAAYRTISSGEFNLLVERGDDGGSAVAGYEREDLRIVGSDIRFIKTTGVVLNRISDDPFGSLSFYLWYIMPLLLFIGFITFQNRYIRDRADIARMKNRRASKTARLRLKSAGRYLKENNSQQFYEETLKAIWGYLSDKLLIPVSDLNRQNTRSALLEKGIPEKHAGQLIGILDDCEFARYAQTASTADKNRVYNETLQIITLIEQNIRQQ